MLTVEMTDIPASSSSSTSSHRFRLRDPGAFVWASSSTSASWGRRARTASTAISASSGSPVLQIARRDDLEAAQLRRGLGPAMLLEPANDHVIAARGSARALVEHCERLADTRRGTEVDAVISALARLGAEPVGGSLPCPESSRFSISRSAPDPG